MQDMRSIKTWRLIMTIQYPFISPNLIAKSERVFPKSNVTTQRFLGCFLECRLLIMPICGRVYVEGRIF